MRATLAFLALAIVTAGCASSPGSDSTDPLPSASPTPTGGPLGGVPAREPVPMDLPVALDGNLGTFAHYCVFPAGHCDTHKVKPGVIDLEVAHPGSNFTGLDVNLTWTSSSPVNDELVLGFMVMDTCPECPDPFEDEVRGTSPLRAQVSGERIPLNGTTVVHLYVYNPKAFQMLPGGAGYTFSSVDDAFRLEGAIRVEMDG